MERINFMDKQVLSIQIGERLTKVCVVTKRGHSGSVGNSVIFPTPDQSVIDGQISNSELIGDVLKENLLQSGMGDIKGTVFVMSSPKIVTRKITLPPVKPKQIKAIIAANASDYFPIDLTNYHLSHTILDSKISSKADVNILVTAVPKQILRGYEKIAEVAKLNIQAFDYTLNSQYQAFSRIASEGVTMYLDVDTRQSYATFMQDGNMLLQRAVPFGGDEVLNNIMHIANIDESQIISALKLCSNVDWIRQNVPQERYEGSIMRILGAIERAIDFFKSSNKNIEVSRIVLFNSCSAIAGLKDAIARTTSVPTMYLQDLPGVEKVLGGENINIFAACGAGVIEPLDITLDALSSSSSKGKNKGSSPVVGNNLGVIVLVGLIAIGAVLSATTIISYTTARAENARLTARLEELQVAKQKYDTYVSYNAMQDNFVILEGQAVNKNAELRAFLEELEAKMPTNIVVLSATCDSFGVTINVETSTMEEAAVTMSQLRTFESIVEISTSGVSQSQTDEGLGTVSFSIVCSYAQAQEETLPTETMPESYTEDEMLSPP